MYLGLSDFSARKAARNFSIPQLRILRQIASDQGKRILVTVNTVILERERRAVAELLFELSTIEVDGVIVQDFGVLAMLRQGFPDLPIHASTQMAVQDTHGLELLAGLGVKRAVLPRELSLDEIARLRKDNPDIELEVFIHGALCYSVSGLCLMSGTLLDRSANRGECAQMCRNIYQHSDRQAGFFSCHDLALANKVQTLAALGVDSLKIEGRMKPPEYVSAVVRLYRRFLDRGTAPGAAELESLQKNIDLTFSRGTTQAFFEDTKGKNLLGPEFTTHRGILLGKVRSSWKDGFSVVLAQPVRAHDGLMYLSNSKPPKPIRFGLKRMVLVQGKERTPGFEARAGDLVEIAFAEPPPKGAELFLISSSELKTKPVKVAQFPPHRMAIGLDARLDDQALVLSSRLLGQTCTKTYPVQLELARGERDFGAILTSLFAQSGERPFQIQRVDFSNQGGPGPGSIFIPPSRLKRIKNEFYQELSEHFETQRSAQVDTALALSPPGALTPWPAQASAPIPRQIPRKSLSPQGGLPFVPRLPVELDHLARWNEFCVLPLKPLVLGDEGYAQALEAFVRSYPEQLFLIGLNHVGQLALAHGLYERCQNVFFFLDVFCYLANAAAAHFFFSTVPRLLFAYSWIEADAKTLSPLDESLPSELASRIFPVGHGFSAPLFISRVCLQRHALGGCPSECTKSLRIPFRAGRLQGWVIVEDCLNYTFLE